MDNLKIFIDLALPPDVLKMLQTGTKGHQLVFAKQPLSSILAKPEPDPQFSSIDIAFGQPDPQSVKEAPQLKWIHVSSSGITRYDNPQFRSMIAERNILVSNSASVYSEPCAIHLMSFILAQTRNLPHALETRTACGTPTWNALRHSSISLRGKTLLILGYGAIAKRLVELLRPFGMHIIAFRRKIRGDEGIPVITADQLDDTLTNQVDHIVNILPDNAETHHFFNETRFSTIKSGAVFYNIGRGTTVDQDALLKALRSGRIRAAWLDVTHPEPLPDNHPLFAESNCFITPHIAGGHAEETKMLVSHFLKNFECFIQGKPLVDQVQTS